MKKNNIEYVIRSHVYHKHKRWHLQFNLPIAELFRGMRVGASVCVCRAFVCVCACVWSENAYMLAKTYAIITKQIRLGCTHCFLLSISNDSTINAIVLSLFNA